MPKDSEGKTLGYAFIEYNTPQVITCDPRMHALIGQIAQKGKRLGRAVLFSHLNMQGGAGSWGCHATGLAFINFAVHSTGERGWGACIWEG